MSTQSVRAKFKVIRVDTIEEQNHDGESYTFKRMYMEPVISGSPENEEFFRLTPSGRITLDSVNPDVVFTEGEERYVDFILPTPEAGVI